MIIAVDFDGTLCRNAWPEIGEPNLAVMAELVRLRRQGDKVILWTCRTGRKLYKAIRWCHQYGLDFDAVNENLPEMIEKYGNDCRKVFADEYWDDKSVIAAKWILERNLGEWDDPFFLADDWRKPLEETKK